MLKVLLRLSEAEISDQIAQLLVFVSGGLRCKNKHQNLWRDMLTYTSCFPKL